MTLRHAICTSAEDIKCVSSVSPQTIHSHNAYILLQYSDNASNTRKYAAGTVVPFTVDIEAHHTGYAVSLHSLIFHWCHLSLI